MGGELRGPVKLCLTRLQLYMPQLFLAVVPHIGARKGPDYDGSMRIKAVFAIVEALPPGRLPSNKSGWLPVIPSLIFLLKLFVLGRLFSWFKRAAWSVNL
jgi:hypothetical protein